MEDRHEKALRQKDDFHPMSRCRVIFASHMDNVDTGSSIARSREICVIFVEFSPVYQKENFNILPPSLYELYQDRFLVLDAFRLPVAHRRCS